MISQRTKAALRVARERVALAGQRKHPDVTRLGNPNGARSLTGRGNIEALAAIKAKADATAQRLRGVLSSLHNEGITTTRGMTRALNERGVLSPHGGSWHPNTVIRVRKRIESLRVDR
jgi:hypothetical protein